jgi:prephenate dehydrogenase
MAIQITILGLGQVGASIGLALAEKKDAIQRVGNDREPEFAKRAQKLGAVDQVQHNLPNAVRKADAVVLAMPVDEIRETLEVIAEDLKEGCVVIDTSPVKIGVSDWAQKILPKDRYFVAMTPTLNPAYLDDPKNGLDAAHADLFHNSLMVITSPSGANADALKLASDLAVLLGSTPFFADAYETDGLMAAVRLLPELVAAALMDATSQQPGWHEARKLAGPVFAQATRPLVEPSESKFFGQSALLNKDNTLRMLDQMIAALRNTRQALADGDEEGLKGQIDKAVGARLLWETQRRKSDWANLPTNPLPTSGEIMGRLFGLGRKSNKDKKN